MIFLLVTRNTIFHKEIKNERVIATLFFKNSTNNNETWNINKDIFKWIYQSPSRPASPNINTQTVNKKKGG
jgi:hypothetical protein